jgi:hypothetical protein
VVAAPNVSSPIFVVGASRSRRAELPLVNATVSCGERIREPRFVVDTGLAVILARRSITRREVFVTLGKQCFNVTNTPHFANPSTNMSNVTFNPDGTIRALNGVGAINV